MIKKHFFVYYFLLVCCALQAQKEVYTVGLLFDIKNTEIDPFIEQLQAEIKAVVGEDAVIQFPKDNFRVNGFSSEQAEINYNDLLGNETDIIVAFGPVNNKVISEREVYQKPTLLFGDINQDFGYYQKRSRTSETENFTYVLSPHSTQKDLQTLQQLTGCKRVGVAIQKELIETLPFQDLLDQQTEQLGLDYQLLLYDKGSDLLSQISDSIDAVYLINGYFLENREIEELANLLIKERIPSLTNTGVGDVELGMMATNQSANNIKQLIRHIALAIEGHINGKDFSEQEVFVKFENKLTVNHNTSRQIGMSIKYSLIANTNFVGEVRTSKSEESYSLVRAINEGVLRNLSYQTNRKDLALSMQDIHLAKSNYLPDLTLGATGVHVDPDLAEVSLGQAPEFSTDANLSFSQLLYSQSATTNVGIQEELFLAENEDLHSEQLDLVFDISNAYFQILILKANVSVQFRNLDLTKQNLLTAEQNFEAGQNDKTDVLRFRSELAQNTQSMVESVNELEQGFISLKQLLNLPLDVMLEVEDLSLEDGVFKQLNYEEVFELLDEPKLREPFIDFLVNEAKNNSPELKSLTHSLNATDKSIRLYGSGRFVPTLSLVGEYNQNFSRSGAGSESALSIPTDDYNAALSLSLPIFSGYNNKINRQTAEIQKDQLQIIESNTALSIEVNVRNNVLTLINQIANIQLSKVSEETAKESLELVQSQYANGAVSIIQLLDYQNNYLNAQIAKTNATYTFLISALLLERSVGNYFILSSEEDNNDFMNRFMEYAASKKQ